MGDIKNYKCLNCGNSVVFDPTAGDFKCDYCASHFTEEEVSKSVVETKATDKDKVTLEYSGVNVDAVDPALLREYHCNNCGSEMIVDGTTSATFCVYCKSPIVLAEKLTNEFRPNRLIPFKLTQKEAEQIYYKWIKKKIFAPTSFKNMKSISEIRGVYAPFWLFNSNYSGSITGEATIVKTWSDSDYDYVETSYYDIMRSGNIYYQNIPVDSSSKLDDDLMHAIEPYDYAEFKNFNMAYLSGFLAERHDVSLDDSAVVAKERMSDYFEDTLKGTCTGYDGVTVSSRDFYASNMSYDNVMMPVYYLANKYKGELKAFMINGQTGQIYGNTPTDRGMVAAVFAGLTVIFTLLVAILGGVFNG